MLISAIMQSVISNLSLRLNNRLIHTSPKINKTCTRLADFYDGKSVFVTGGTGFLGKAFIEKMVYSFETIDKVYVLVRSKQGMSASQRIQQLIDAPIFDRVKSVRPENLYKIVPINGDISIPNLGLTAEDIKLLEDNVSVVIHSAATVRFNEPLSVAMNLNFEGTRRVMSLCHRMKKLDNFVYISTAFTQPHIRVLEEKMYPPPTGHMNVYKHIEKHGDNMKIAKQVVGGYPNTYTFSKALTENYVAGNPESIPTVIIRPSIVTAAYREPVSGWIEGLSSSILFADVACGLNRYFMSTKENVCDFVPVDYVVNLTLIAAARSARGAEVAFYNSSTSGCNPNTYMQIFNIFFEESLKNKHYVRYPKIVFVQSNIAMYVKTFLTQTLRAYATDFLLRLGGEEPRHVKQQTNILKRRATYSYFTSNSWIFKSDKAQEIYGSLPIEDQKEFPCDPKDINWQDYLRIYYDGIFKYLVKKYRN